MSVKAKDRHISKNICLQYSRELMNYILILTRPRCFDENGKQVCKPGLLGEGQPLQAFGLDFLKYGKLIHAICHKSCNIYLNSQTSFKQKEEYWNQAIEYCESILRLIDLCIYQYARNNLKKIRSFEHFARLTYKLKQTLLDRKNRDKLIYEQNYKESKIYKKGR